MELGMQRNNPLRAIGHYPVDRSEVFRRSTDPISAAAAKRLTDYSNL